MIRATVEIKKRPDRRVTVIAIAAIWLAVTGYPTPSPADQTDSAGAFLQAYADKSMRLLTEPGVNQRQRELRFRSLLAEGFDLPTIAAFVLGRYNRTATPEQKSAFLEVFKDAMAQRFVPLFSRHANERLLVIREYHSDADPRSTFVRSRITQPSEQPVTVDWRIRKRDQRFRIIDVTIDGVSMLVTLRAEYTSVLARNDGRVDKLIDLLRKRVSQGAFAPDRQSGNTLD